MHKRYEVDTQQIQSRNIVDTLIVQQYRVFIFIVDTPQIRRRYIVDPKQIIYSIDPKLIYRVDAIQIHSKLTVDSKLIHSRCKIDTQYIYEVDIQIVEKCKGKLLLCCGKFVIKSQCRPYLLLTKFLLSYQLSSFRPDGCVLYDYMGTYCIKKQNIQSRHFTLKYT